MLARAIESIDEDDFENREITSVTLRFDPDQIVAAKNAIRQFRDNFHKQFESIRSEHVYQVNLQFFEHTQPKPRVKEIRHEIH